MNERISAAKTILACHLLSLGSALESCRVQTLDETGDNRWIVGLEASVRQSQGTVEQRFVAKFYSDASGDRAYHALRHVHRCIRATEPAPVLAVGEPLYYDPDTLCLLLAYVPGRRLDEPSLRQDLPRWTELVGRALAWLHGNVPPLDSPVRSLDDHLQRTVSTVPGSLVQSYPEYKSAIERRIEDWKGIERRWGTVRQVTIHGDFHLRQLFADDGRVWAIDWDDAAVGDPAFDVAYFLAYLQNHLSESDASAASDAFVSGYGRDAVSNMQPRLRTYRAYNDLRRACRRFRRKDRNWEAQMHAHLRRLQEP